jgi:hypothetical protein
LRKLVLLKLLPELSEILKLCQSIGPVGNRVVYYQRARHLKLAMHVWRIRFVAVPTVAKEHGTDM